MTRDELIETMARAGVRAGIQSEHLSRCAATFMASAIETAGLAIVPIEATVSDPHDYDAGLLNDFGGGNVEWWQDYIRAEIARANDFWRSQTGPAMIEAGRL